MYYRRGTETSEEAQSINSFLSFSLRFLADLCTSAVDRNTINKLGLRIANGKVKCKIDEQIQ
jgi:hypothetical protein